MQPNQADRSRLKTKSSPTDRQITSNHIPEGKTNRLVIEPLWIRQCERENTASMSELWELSSNIQILDVTACYSTLEGASCEQDYWLGSSGFVGSWIGGWGKTNAKWMKCILWQADSCDKTDAKGTILPWPVHLCVRSRRQGMILPWRVDSCRRSGRQRIILRCSDEL